jgi:exocyst complex protein 7
MMARMLVAWMALRATVERSHTLSDALARPGTRMEEIKVSLLVKEAAGWPIYVSRDVVEGASSNIDRAVGPLWTCSMCLTSSLLASASTIQDLPGYLAVIGKLKEVLHFLYNSCGLVAQWLSDIIEFLREHSLAEPLFMS